MSPEPFDPVRDLYDLSPPGYDLAGPERQTSLRLALVRRELHRRDLRARPPLLRRLIGYVTWGLDRPEAGA